MSPDTGLPRRKVLEAAGAGEVVMGEREIAARMFDLACAARADAAKEQPNGA